MHSILHSFFFCVFSSSAVRFAQLHDILFRQQTLLQSADAIYQLVVAVLRCCLLFLLFFVVAFLWLFYPFHSSSFSHFNPPCTYKEFTSIRKRKSVTNHGLVSTFTTDTDQIRAPVIFFHIVPKENKPRKRKELVNMDREREREKGKVSMGHNFQFFSFLSRAFKNKK